ncbi:ribonuclease Z [Maridesulfovibrio sp.]|uniref:MBL fold metallo-hydrolase n=1 Tax=Maridesulfovibrio sp. TaxID=2795000 RepID=UPI0029F5B2CD|nr:ribonuclease Z [Maridesulfovibrio sp.]
MKCVFLGIGSAFDAGQTNVSILVECGGNRILLDCGFNAGHACMNMVPDAHDIDALWISHFHGDHFFGLPFLLGSFFNAGREKTFHICGPEGIEDKVTQTVNLAYPSLLGKIGFGVVFHEFKPGDVKFVSGFGVSTCAIDHSGSAQAIRLECAGKVLFYTGDGALNDDCTQLAKNAQLGILEAYSLDGPVKKGHSSIMASVNFAISARIDTVCLVHLENFVRTCRVKNVLKQFSLSDSTVIIPEQGQVFEI